MGDYSFLRSDPAFLFRPIRIKDSCYDSIRKMLMYQSEEQLRSRSFGRVSFQKVASTEEMGKKTTPRRLLPLENQLS